MNESQEIIIPNSQPETTTTSNEELDLTGLFDVPVISTENEDNEKAEILQKIQKCKRFYLENFNNQINLNHESFVRFSGILNFDVGYKYKNLVEKMDKVELLVQLVNERHKLRSVCKTVYFREASLKLDTATNRDLLSKYLGLGVKENKAMVKQELKEYSWFLKVYRNRLLFVCNELQSRFGLAK